MNLVYDSVSKFRNLNEQC